MTFSCQSHSIQLVPTMQKKLLTSSFQIIRFSCSDTLIFDVQAIFFLLHVKRSQGHLKHFILWHRQRRKGRPPGIEAAAQYVAGNDQLSRHCNNQSKQLPAAVKEPQFQAKHVAISSSLLNVSTLLRSSMQVI